MGEGSPRGGTSNDPSHVALWIYDGPLLRFLISNTHHAEGIGAVRCPVVLGTKPDVAGLVVLLMIPAEGIDAGRAGFGIEPDRRKQPATSLDFFHGGALALVGHGGDEEAGRADVILEADGRDCILLRTIMGQIALGVAIAARPQPFEMRSQRLPDSFVVVIETPGDGLITFQGMQDHTAVMLRGTELPTGATVVRANWSDNPWLPAELEQERKDCLRTDPDQYGHIWEGDYASVLSGAYYAASLTVARQENRIGRLARDPLMPIKAFWDIGVRDATAIWIAQFVGREIRVLELVGFAQSADSQLVLKQPLGQILQALLDLADADRAQAGLGQTVLDQQTGKEMRLARATAAMRALVPGSAQQRLEGFGCFDLKADTSPANL